MNVIKTEIYIYITFYYLFM